MARRVVQLGLVVVALLLGGVDIGLLLDDVEGNTFSSIIQDAPWAIGLLGFAAVHVSRKPDGVQRSWALVAFGAVGSVVLATLAQGGVIGLILGGVVGWFAWGNSGKS